MYLINPPPAEGELEEMLVAPDNSEQGNCTQRILIDKVHRGNWGR
jgi:hypothetical protein